MGGDGSPESIEDAEFELKTRRGGKCVPKTKTVPAFQIQVDGLQERIEYMKDHALIGKFVGIWPSEKALNWWINKT